VVGGWVQAKAIIWVCTGLGKVRVAQTQGRLARVGSCGLRGRHTRTVSTQLATPCALWWLLQSGRWWASSGMRARCTWAKGAVSLALTGVKVATCGVVNLMAYFGQGPGTATCLPPQGTGWVVTCAYR